MAAVRATWVKPAWVSRREINGAWLLEMTMEAVIEAGDSEMALSERLSMAIWKRLGRYVKVVVDVAVEESDEVRHHELGQADYRRWMRTI